MLKGMGSISLSEQTRKTEESSQTISEIAEQLKEAASDLYFAERRIRLAETIENTT